jgi:HSP90 family molecular chaperone
VWEQEKMASKTPKPKATSGRKVRLKPANPFDLIRLIAHSQSDPRKALAELVQNSLDADAAQVIVSRQRRRGEIILSVLDNGRGIFPELPRPDALERIATNIGHSFKRNLSVAERQRQMLLGKYGIGILGFWCVGQELEIRSRVAGSEV